MNYIKIIIGFIGLSLTFSACQEDHLEQYPLDEIPALYFFKKPNDLKIYMNQYYHKHQRQWLRLTSLTSSILLTGTATSIFGSSFGLQIRLYAADLALCLQAFFLQSRKHSIDRFQFFLHGLFFYDESPLTRRSILKVRAEFY